MRRLAQQAEARRVIVEQRERHQKAGHDPGRHRQEGAELHFGIELRLELGEVGFGRLHRLGQSRVRFRCFPQGLPVNSPWSKPFAQRWRRSARTSMVAEWRGVSSSGWLHSACSSSPAGTPGRRRATRCASSSTIRPGRSSGPRRSSGEWTPGAPSRASTGSAPSGAGRRSRLSPLWSNGLRSRPPCSSMSSATPWPSPWPGAEGAAR